MCIFKNIAAYMKGPLLKRQSCQGKQQPQMNSVETSANDVLDGKRVCKVERYIEMDSMWLVCVFEKMAAYMKGDYTENNVAE